MSDMQEFPRYCQCGHAMIDTEEMYSELYDEMVQLWECPYCHTVEEDLCT